MTSITSLSTPKVVNLDRTRLQIADGAAFYEIYTLVPLKENSGLPKSGWSYSWKLYESSANVDDATQIATSLWHKSEPIAMQITGEFWDSKRCVFTRRVVLRKSTKELCQVEGGNLQIVSDEADRVKEYLQNRSSVRQTVSGKSAKRVSVKNPPEREGSVLPYFKIGAAVVTSGLLGIGVFMLAG